MKQKLLNNWLLKLLSIAAAFAVWMVVMNIQDPTDTYTISDISLTVLNEDVLTDAGLTYDIAEDTSVSVEATVRRTNKKKVTAAAFEAVIDLSEVYSTTSAVEVQVSVVKNSSLILSWTQITRSVTVNIEEMQTKEFDIVMIQSGEPASSYLVESDDAVITPQTVSVTAPASIMDTIAYAGVTVSVEGVSDSFTAEGAICFYDADGSLLTITDDRFSADTETASVYVPVYNTTDISVSVNVSGQDALADGYVYINYAYSPQTVTVTGPKSLMADLEIVIEQDLTGESETFTAEYDITDYLPEGLSLGEGETGTVTVTYYIEELETRTFEISSSDVALKGSVSDFTYDISGGDDIAVTITGLGDDIRLVSESDIYVTVDVSGITEPGTYEITPGVSVSDEYSAYVSVSAETITVTVSSPDEEEDETAGEETSEDTED